MIKVEKPATNNPTANIKNGRNGKPVPCQNHVCPVIARKNKNIEARNNAFGLPTICPVTSEPSELAAEERVINTPAAIDIKRDGNWDAKPSPIVKTVYLETASATGI